MHRKTVSSVMLVLLVTSMLVTIIDIHPAYASVSFASWWVDNVQVTFAYVGEVVTGQIYMQGEAAGDYNLRIRRDISLAPDETVESTIFYYDGGYSLESLTFIPSIATGESSTSGYHMDLYRYNGASWLEVWTLENSYPPRLIVYRGNPTVLNFDRPPSTVSESETIVFTGQLTKSHTGAGISEQTISIYDIHNGLAMATGATQSNGAFSIPWTAIPMDMGDRTVEVYALFAGSSIYLSSRDPDYYENPPYYLITVESLNSLTVSSAHDSPSPSIGNHFYGNGSSVTCSIMSPVTEGGVSYTCTGWSGTGSVPSSGAGTSVTFKISQNSTITWNWVPQWSLTVSSAHDSPSPSVGVHTYNDGSSVTCSVTSPVVEGGVSYTCTGWNGTGSVPSSGSGTSVTFTISQDSAITWSWAVTQWKLTVSSAHDSPNPSFGDHLCGDGSSVTCSVTSPVTENGIVYTCTGWTGTGSVLPSGTDSYVTFAISQNSTITWNWHGTAIQRKLTVGSAHGSPSPAIGDHLCDNGTSVACSISSPVNEGGTIWACTGWSGSGFVPSSGIGTTITFTITQNSTITWNWIQVVQPSLTVSSAHDSPSPSAGDHYYSDGQSLTCTVSTPVTEGNITYVCTGWSGTGSVPSNGSGTSISFTINRNSSITWNWQAQAVSSFISVRSEFSGYFLANVHLPNTFGVYTNLSGRAPVEVYGTLDGTNRTFSAPAGLGGSYNYTVDMGSLKSNSTLEVFAVYSDGKVLNQTVPLKIVATPSWLMSILNTARAIDVEKEKEGDWDNSYTVHIDKEFPLQEIYKVKIPLPKLAGGGDYKLLPSVAVEFSFYSNGTFSIACPVTLETPEVSFGVGAVNAYVTISVSGTFNLQNNTVNWVSATFSLEVGAHGHAHIPIYGDTYDVPTLGETTVGLSATVSVDASFAANLVIAPTKNASQQFISGVELMIQSITGQISFEVGVRVNGGIGIASLSGGGSVDFVMNLAPVQPYISGGVATGTVSIKWHVLWWSGTLWSMSGTLYSWENVTKTMQMGIASNLDSISDFAVTPRYYNTTDYERFVWTNGFGSATAVQNVYPFTRISAASHGDSVYIVYSSDNVSVPQEEGPYVKGLQFNSSQRALQNLVLPPVADEILFDPVVVSLSNGTLLAIWDSIPSSETIDATSPFEISKIILQYSYFDTQTRSWSPVRNLTETGIATSYLLSSDSTGCYALILGADSIFSTTQNLIEYNVQSSSQLQNMNVANVSNIMSYNSLSHLAVMQLMDGSYELLNLTSHEAIAIPSMDGYEIKNVQLASNSTDFLGILYTNSTSGSFSIYNISSSTSVFSMNVSESTSYMTLIKAKPGYQLITANPAGIISYLIENQSEASLFYPLENITSMGATITDNGILVYTTEDYGNSSYPLLNLTLTLVRGLPGDLNGDFKASLADLVILAQAYGSKPGDSNWNPNADIDNSGRVGLSDLVILAQHYGQHYP